MSTADRRGFLKRALAGAALAGAGAGAGVRAQDGAGVKVDRRVLGRLGKEVSVYGLGLGSVFTKAFENDADAKVATLERALDLGVNYWDTATDYGNSQALLGPVVEQHRDRIFLVSKSSKRTYDGFMRDLEKSLELLKTDRIDLYHCHNMGSRKKEDVEDDMAVFEDGCVKAARQAKAEGIIGGWGVTGHSGAGILVKFIERYDPDAILTVFPADGRGGEYEQKILPLVQARNMGAIAMKTVRQARQSDLKGSDLPRYAISLPGITTAIVGLAKLSELEENARMASNFEPLTDEQMAAMAQTVRMALRGAQPPWEHPDYDDCCLV